jgi:hypothetical protein
MIVLGIDPDLHSPAFALVEDGVPIAVGVGKVPAKLKGWDAVHAQANLELPPVAYEFFDRLVMEGQEIYPRSKARPNDLVRLAFSAGLLAGRLGRKDVIIAIPKEWTGGVRKDVRQARQYKRLGWAYEKDRAKTYAYPTDPPIGKDLPKGAWKHVADAIGLALWGEQQ